MKYSELNLEDSLFKAIEKLNYDSCTPIQEQSIPHIIVGKDVAGLAQTGTGKTAAFLIPIMERILRSRPVQGEIVEDTKKLISSRAFPEWQMRNFILVLVPTRELAEQVYENVTKLSEFSGLRGCSVYGGTGYEKQKELIQSGAEFVVATPGRLIDLYKDNIIDLKQVRAVIFDEADRMFDMGFKDDMKYILQRIPKDRQFLVFSATLNFDVLNTAYQFGADPVEINISRDQAKAENVKDLIFHVGQDEKPQHLLSLLKKHNPKQVIIFTNFKNNVDRIAKFLNDNNYPAMAISSLISQSQRNKVIENFKAENNLNILVATDVAARGLDIKGVDMVINFEIPMDSESYVHRIGRTGRAGSTGMAFSLVSDRDIDSLYRVEEYLKNKIEIGFLEDADLIKEFQAFPDDHFTPGRAMRPPHPERSHKKDGHHSGPRKPRRDGRGGESRNNDRGGDSRNDHGDRDKNRSYGRSQDGQRTEKRNDGQRGEFRNNDNRNGENRSGDFKNRNQNGRPHHEKNNDQKSKFNKSSHGNKGHSKSHSHNKQARTSHSAPPKTIGQKVAGFFKNLFK